MQFWKNSSPQFISTIVGERLKRIRLNKDLTQLEVADLAWVNRRTVLNAEKGDVKLSDLIAILGALNMLDNLDIFVPELPLSPIQLHKLRGKERKRASGTNKKPKIKIAEKPLDW
ncbi:MULTISPECIES: helix-turn-helix transcriptional regulator [unclassified Acinetobacter]|uniref:helix-turn-helix transcriptional regulator n=1 Tax=unclassified Acinetobacter TaxID=196816 RepID=UPI0015D33B1A|nr:MULTISPECIES: helix-turn-helix transcriptional regulator [unclassified Acinetobacter]